MGLFDRFRKKDAPSPEVQGLMNDLSSDQAPVRAQAAKRLGELGSAAAAAQPALEDAIADVDGDVCLAASDALSKIRKDSV